MLRPIHLPSLLPLALLLFAACSAPEPRKPDPRRAISLREIADDLNAIYYWDGDAGKGVLATSDWRIVALPELDRLLIDRSELPLTEPVVQHGQDLYLSRRYYEERLRPLMRVYGRFSPQAPPRGASIPGPRAEPPAQPRELTGWTVAVDAGHGGHDHGASVGGVQEKQITLRVALLLAGMLRQGGARVVLTRSADRYVGLDRRVDLAREGGCDLFVSIHANTCPQSHVRGVEVFVKSQPSAAAVVHRSRDLARRIADQIASRTGTPNRGVKLNRRNLRVLRRSAMPAVLVEMGFLSHHEERSLLVDQGYQQRLADSVRLGIVGHVRASGGRPASDG